MILKSGFEMKKFLFAVAVGLISFSSVAEIRWIEKDFDFGTWKEITGPKNGTSRFVNAGTDTIAIVNVKPSCGCTSAYYTDTPIAPGDTAIISYVYDSTMRPGKFDKSVRVSLSDGTRHVLRIRGNVIGTPESLASLYPVEAGEMRLSDSAVSFGQTNFGRSPIAFVNAYILSQDSIVPVMKSDNPALKITSSADKAGPGDIVTFSLILDTKKLDEYGPVEIPYQYGKALAVVLPDPGNLVIEQQGKNPIISIKSDLLEVGELSGGKTFPTGIVISNEGKGKLEILKVYSTDESVNIIKTPRQIKPGKSAEITFDINPLRLNGGAFRIPVEIISNDPSRPKATIKLVGIKN